MKRLLRIFELSKNEQRVVLIVMLILIAGAFITYERRGHHPTAAIEPKPSPTPLETDAER
jgi:hypothetical protein